jgi:LysR family transcriptional regulator, chromosome initiation inhibitor
MLPLDNQQLRALAAVVHEGSFERAARVLHVTPSAVSQRIKALEQAVGAVLVHRGVPCRATAAGLPLVGHAEQLALLEAQLMHSLQGASARGSAAPAWLTLRLAVNADSLATWFIDALAAFTARAPHVRLDVVIDDQDHTADALRRGEVLAAVTSQRLAVAGCNSSALGLLRYVATASPAFMRRHFARGVDTAALRIAPCIVFNRKDALQARWLKKVSRAAINPPCHWLPSSQAFVDGSLAGLGWGMNPLPLVKSHLAAGRLQALAPDKPVDVPLYWQASRLQAPLLAQLTDAVHAAARRHLM